MLTPICFIVGECLPCFAIGARWISVSRLVVALLAADNQTSAVEQWFGGSNIMWFGVESGFWEFTRPFEVLQAHLEPRPDCPVCESFSAQHV